MNEVKGNHFYSVFLLLIFWVPASFAQMDEERPETDTDQRAVDAASAQQFKIPTEYFQRAEGAPRIDGKLDDPFWTQAKSLSITKELYPIRLAEAVVSTTVLLAVTETHIYVGFSAYDPDIKNLRSAPRARDATKEDDYVSIIVDPTGQLTKKYEFRVNPHGSLSDVLQDSISDRYIYDWDADWEGAAVIAEQAYYVEMAIPLDAIKLPEDYDSADEKWVIVLKRSYPRQVDRTLGQVFFAKPHQVQETKTTPLSESRSEESNKATTIEWTPYYIYHLDEEGSIGESLEQVDDHKVHEVGFDAKIQYSTSSSAAVTVNPNFTEVEADIARQSINNPFTVFQPEKRRFFQDDKELYTTLMPVIYSRNIEQPLLGVAFANTEESSSSGAFFINDKKTKLIMPDNLGSDTVEVDTYSRSAALRYQKTINRKTLGVIASLRQGDDYRNVVAGLDGIINLGIDDKLRYQFMYSSTQYPERFADDLCEQTDCTKAPPPEECPPGECPVNPYVLRADFSKTLKDYALRLGYKHDGPESLYWVNYYDAAPEFRADLGFIRRVDYRLLNVAYGRKWYVETLRSDEGKSRLRGYVVGQRVESHAGELIEKEASLWGEFRGSFQTVFRIGKRFKERAVNRVDQGSTSIEGNAPLFDEDYWQWYLEVAPSVQLTVNLDGRYGEMADADNLVLGDMAEIKPKLTYRLDNLELMASATVSDFDYEGSRLYKEQFLSLAVTYRRTDRLSHRLLILDDTTKRDVNRFVGDELAFENERSLEYTLTYKIKKQWSFLTGFKLTEEENSEAQKRDLTNQELYFKVVYNFETSAARM